MLVSVHPVLSLQLTPASPVLKTDVRLKAPNRRDRPADACKSHPSVYLLSFPSFTSLRARSLPGSQAIKSRITHSTTMSVFPLIDPCVHYGDFRDQLAKEGGAIPGQVHKCRLRLRSKTGWVVIKGAVPRERALVSVNSICAMQCHILIAFTRPTQQYRDDFYTFVESFDLGFKRDDSSTWTPEHFPIVARGGLFGHSLGHEAFMWKIRQEPAVIDAFAKCWGTDELLVSFDGG